MTIKPGPLSFLASLTLIASLGSAPALAEDASTDAAAPMTVQDLVNYVDNWQTSMLAITGEQDFRISYTQEIASFTALQRKKISSQLLVFPEENHWVLKPKNSLQWHGTVFSWLDRWLKEEPAEK